MIELHNVNFRYAGGSDAGELTDINLTIPYGQVILLCGRSGCGKTTLTRLINGLIPNYYEGELTGEVLLDGKNISKIPLYQTAKYVGSVFQNPRTQFFTVDSTSELAFGSENQGVQENEIVERIIKTTELFGISALLGKNIFKMSGGEKQKIACASVSVTDLPIVVLDEPSSNLDISATKDLQHMIEVWKSQGKTIIIAEHRLFYLSNLVDRVIYLKNGKIVSEFSMKEIQRLDKNELFEMGLRPFDLFQYPVKQTEMTDDEIFSLSDMYFSYKKETDVLNIPVLQLPRHGVIALIGHNGAGKSTLARCLCGLEKKCKGIVTIDGKRYNRKQRLRYCYMVMQDVNHQLFTESVDEELLLSMVKPDKMQIDDTLKRLDLDSFAERHPMSLSGGQKQRVAIASALVSNREILIFDEPTSGLDLLHMYEVAKSLEQLQHIGKTSIVITHDYELIVSCCTYVVHLEHGRVEEQYALDREGVMKLQNFFAEEGTECMERINSSQIRK